MQKKQLNTGGTANARIMMKPKKNGKKFEEEKLDANKDGKLTGEDFAMLRSRKKINKKKA